MKMSFAFVSAEHSWYMIMIHALMIFVSTVLVYIAHVFFNVRNIFRDGAED
jgi:polyferredoxin